MTDRCWHWPLLAALLPFTSGLPGSSAAGLRTRFIVFICRCQAQKRPSGSSTSFWVLGGPGGAALCRRAAARWWCASLPEHPCSFPLPSPSIPAPFSSSLPEHPCSIPSFLLQHPCSFSPFPPRAALHLPREHPCPWGLCSALGTTLRTPELLSLHPKVILEMKAGRQGQEGQGQQPLSASFLPSRLWSSLSCLPGHPAICISRGRDAFSPSAISYWEPLWKPNSVCVERWPPQPPINCCCQP